MKSADRTRPLGRLRRVAAPVGRQFGYDGSELIAEHADGGAVLRRYVHGPGEDEPLAWYEGNGADDVRWFAADELGSTVALTDRAGARTINTYDEYGVPGQANVGLFQYTGQMWLREAGLYHYKARAYSPTLGRFLQPDPIGYGDGMNLYAYVGADPVNGTDPTGMVPRYRTATGSRIQCISTCQVKTVAGYGVDPTPKMTERANIATARALGATVLNNGTVTALGPLFSVALGKSGGSSLSGGEYGRATTRPVPFPPVEVQTMADIADRIAGLVPVGTPFRGTLIHFFADRAYDSLGGNYMGGVSYIGEAVVKYGTRGSVRTDGGYGFSAGAPDLIVEIKTGGAYLSNRQARGYSRNLPRSTPVYVFGVD